MIPNERRNQTSTRVVVAKDNIKWKNKTLSFAKQKEKKLVLTLNGLPTQQRDRVDDVA